MALMAAAKRVYYSLSSVTLMGYSTSSNLYIIAVNEPAFLGTVDTSSSFIVVFK